MVAKVQPAAGWVREALPADQKVLTEITERVFSVFGEYGSWLPGYLGYAGVWTFVHEEADGVNGFAMLGVLETDEHGRGRVGDLLAIAVDPTSQDRGIGKVLLERTLEKAVALREVVEIEEVRLTVAEPNERARHLFDTFGFESMAGDHGFYEKGQRALRLKLRLGRHVG